MTSYADRHEASPSPGGGGCDLRNCRHFRGLLGGPAEVRPTQITTRPRRPLGNCDLRNCRHFRGLLGGPAEIRPTQITTRPRRPLGGSYLRVCRHFRVLLGVQRSAGQRRL